jgi:hypothetical protein
MRWTTIPQSSNTLSLETKGVGVTLNERLHIQLFLKSLPHDFKLMRLRYLEKSELPH